MTTSFGERLRPTYMFKLLNSLNTICSVLLFAGVLSFTSAPVLTSVGTVEFTETEEVSLESSEGTLSRKLAEAGHRSPFTDAVSNKLSGRTVRNSEERLVFAEHSRRNGIGAPLLT